MFISVQLLNIADVKIWAASLNRQPSIDDDDGCPDRVPINSILCMPILNGKKDVIGVAQLINKVSTLSTCVNFYRVRRSLLTSSVHYRTEYTDCKRQQNTIVKNCFESSDFETISKVLNMAEYVIFV